MVECFLGEELVLRPYLQSNISNASSVHKGANFIFTTVKLMVKVLYSSVAL